MAQASRLLVVSARLPVAISPRASAAGAGWQVSASPGGLATALRAVAGRRPFLWIGWPGAVVPDEDRAAVARDIAEIGGGAEPVFLGDKDVVGWYEELSNRVLWPLFHSLPVPMRVAAGAWQHYLEVNRQFADAVARLARPGDTVWVHDYQLSLVPNLLRRRELDVAIGYFLHIPFPASETFRTLPMREEVLRGILGADFIGFHSYEHVAHFRSSLLRILGVESDPEHVALPSHHARMGALPIGIEPDEIAEVARRPEVEAELEELRASYRGRKVVLGVDRLDYTKGLPQKLIAFEELLDSNPDLRESVVFIQVAAPSRTGVAEYQRLRREIDELVGRVSGRFSSPAGSPLVYIHQNLPRERLVPLYRLADVALVTPLRDGMNLVCLEYIAARGDDPGRLILSEFTGAAQCLSGAALVNPYNTSQVAAELAAALRSRGDADGFAHMREFVETNTSVAWAERFLARLEATRLEFAGSVRRFHASDPEVDARCAAATRPLLLLDYDGTLEPHVRVPEQAAPSARVRALLAGAAEVAHTYVVSGRPAAVLDRWLGDLAIGLVSEHGLSIKHPGGSWSEPPRIDERVLDEVVAPLFKDFCQRTPGSRIERKAASIAWHHRGSDPRLGAWRANEMSSQLGARLVGQPYSVLLGARVVEVRHVDITKGAAAGQILAANPDTDLVLCAGNDRTDEDMFAALVASGVPSILVYVGGSNTSADFFVETPEELVAELEAILPTWRERNRSRDLRRGAGP
jgi:trehalose 6-phosphate synthase/phosphatase